jgi:hypothetical protein
MALFAALVLAVGHLAGCMDAPTIPADRLECGTAEDLGKFHGRATGALADTVAGCAYFTLDTITKRFWIVMTNGGPLSHETMIKLTRASPPAAFTSYSVGPNPGELIGVIFLGARTFQMQSGTMQALRVSQLKTGYHIEGQVNLTAVDSTGAVLAIMGQFTATCIGAPNPTPGSDPVVKVVKACDPTAAG